MAKRNSPGCNCCVTRPCCSDVWDFVRQDADGIVLTLNASKPVPIINGVTFFESQPGNGFTLYQCSARPFADDVVNSYSAPNHYWERRGVDPATGQLQFSLAYSEVLLKVETCLPNPHLSYFHWLGYGWQTNTNPLSAILDAGYEYVEETPASGAIGSVSRGFYRKGLATGVYHTIRNNKPNWERRTYASGDPPPFQMQIYTQIVLSLFDISQMITAWTFPIHISPDFNPLNYSSTVDLAVP